jgi:hypothetical protein
LFEALTGKSIWAGKSVEEVNTFYQQGKLYPIPKKFQKHTEFCELIEECWNFDPQDRPSFREIRRKIEKSGLADEEMNQDYEVESALDESDAGFTKRFSSAPMLVTHSPKPPPKRAASVPENNAPVSTASSPGLGSPSPTPAPRPSEGLTLPYENANVMDYPEFLAMIVACRHKAKKYVTISFGTNLTFSETPIVWRFTPLPSKDAYQISLPVVAAQSFGKTPETVFQAYFSVNAGHKDNLMRASINPFEPEVFVPRPYNEPDVYAISTRDLKKKKGQKKGTPIQKFVMAEGDRLTAK